MGDEIPNFLRKVSVVPIVKDLCIAAFRLKFFLEHGNQIGR